VQSDNDKLGGHQRLHDLKGERFRLTKYVIVPAPRGYQIETITPDGKRTAIELHPSRTAGLKRLNALRKAARDADCGGSKRRR
jgi:hypothetical protein